MGVNNLNWTNCNLDFIIDKIYGGGTPSRDKSEYWGNEMPWCTVKDLSKFNSRKTIENITKKGLENSSASIVKAGTLITATRMALGKAVIYDVDVTINQDLKAIVLNHIANTNYLFYWFQKNKTYIESLGNGSTVMGISQDELKAIKLVLPPLPEQQKIAAILSKWDELIEQQTQLIAAKEKRKKGLMQKLLTGEVRFPGFSGEWESVELGEVTQVIMGQSPPSSSYNNIGDGLPLIQGNADMVDRISTPRVFTSSPTKTCEINDIIMTVRAPVGAIGKSILRACIGRGVCVVRPRAINPELIYWLLIDFENKWKRLEQGSTFTAVNSTDIKSISFHVPKSKEEQQKIASVLSACDEEIKSLKDELAAMQQQKKGLMQQLLTGKIRVKV